MATNKQKHKHTSGEGWITVRISNTLHSRLVALIPFVSEKIKKKARICEVIEYFVPHVTINVVQKK